MVRYLRIAILPLVAVLTPIPHGMAEGSQTGSPTAATVAKPRIILVGTYEDIRGCHRACDDEYEECIRNIMDVYGLKSKNDPLPASGYPYLENCAKRKVQCRSNCYR